MHTGISSYRHTHKRRCIPFSKIIKLRMESKHLPQKIEKIMAETGFTPVSAMTLKNLVSDRFCTATVPAPSKIAAICLFKKNVCFLSFCLKGFSYLSHLSSQPKNSRCHNIAFCGFNIQWFSSGNTSMRVGTPRNRAALNAIMPCDASMR